MNTQPTPDGHPVLNHRQQRSLLVARRIYAEFRWNLKKAAGTLTWGDIAELIDAATRLCMDLIPDEAIRRQCIEQFRNSKGKVLAMGEQTAKADMGKLFGEACTRCGHEFAADEPKTWVADGQYVCAKCQ